MIYQQVTFEDFRDALRQYNRLDNFSYEGSRILFDYLEQSIQDFGEYWELDVIALCCEFVEMSENAVRENYAIDDVEEYLQDNATICGKYENESGETVFVFQQC